MAKSVTKVVKYGIRNTKTGKPKLVKTGKEVVKATNVSKGANTGGKPWSSDKAALKSEKITEDARTRRAEIAARSIDIANIGQTAQNMTKSIAGVNQQSTAQVSQAVEQAVNGGLEQGSDSRDEDDDEDDSMDAYVA